MKKLIIYFTIFCMTAQACFVPASAAVWRGHAEVTDERASKNEKIYTGEKETVKSKEVVKMVVSQVLTGGITQEGDEFFAEVTDDVEGGSGVVLPMGTLAHGTVRKITDPRRGGRDGWIEVKFDSLITPDGNEIPINASMTTKNSAAVSLAKTAVIDAGYTVTGSLMGGMFMLNLFGIEGAIVSQGYTLAGGAAAGAAMGLGLSLLRKGKDVLISRGDEIKVTINSNVELPVFTKEAFKQEEQRYEGLDVKVDDIWLVKDPFGNRNTFELTLDIGNISDKDFSSFDIAVVSDLRKKYYQSLFFKDAMPLAKIKSGTRVKGKMYFAVDDPRRQHWLVFFDRKNGKPLAKVSLDNAKKELGINFNKKHKKVKTAG